MKVRWARLNRRISILVGRFLSDYLFPFLDCITMYILRLIFLTRFLKFHKKDCEKGVYLETP